METTYVSSDGWMDKENMRCVYISYIHTQIIYTQPYTCNGILAIKTEILPFVTTQMIPKGIMLSEISQKNKHYTILLTYGI